MNNLRTVKNFANSVTLDSTGTNPAPQYVYKLIENGTVSGVKIDGVQFVDLEQDVDGITRIK